MERAPDVKVETASSEEILRAYSWHLQRSTGVQVHYGAEILRRMKLPAGYIVYRLTSPHTGEIEWRDTLPYSDDQIAVMRERGWIIECFRAVPEEGWV